MVSRRTRDRLIKRLEESGIKSRRVLELILNTPRHLFLDEALSHKAYEDVALPIGYGQTLSQPYIVARMTELLLNGSRPLNHVLEVGTGSGYQTSILAQIVKHVYSVERIKPLQDKARQRLHNIKLYNVSLKHSDGGFGWPEKGPFDAIISTAAPAEVPQELLNQLASDGMLVIPVGGSEQFLTTYTRKGDSNEFLKVAHEPVRFVPLLSGITS